MKKLLCALLLVAGLMTLSPAQQSAAFGYGLSFNSYMAPVASGPTTITTLTGAYRFSCTATAAATLTITDAQGSPVTFASQAMAINTTLSYPNSGAYLKMQGVKLADSVNNAINCAVEGYTQ
jgi:hypothetical protein